MRIMTQELHIYLDGSSDRCLTTWAETHAALSLGSDVVCTTQLAALNFANAERLFVHTCDGVCHEITLGQCEGTMREIKFAHNLVKLILNGEFDWYRE